MPRRLTFESIAELPERYRQQVARQLEGQARAQPGRAPVAKAATVFRACSHPVCRQHGHGCERPATWELVIPGRALTTNRFVSALFIRDPAVRAARTAEVGRTYKEWKSAAYAIALHERIPTLATAVVTVQAFYARALPDAGGLTVVGKAMVDGLVEAGVFTDDRGSVLLGEWYPAPRVDRTGDRVVLTVEAGAKPQVRPNASGGS